MKNPKSRATVCFVSLCTASLPFVVLGQIAVAPGGSGGPAVASDRMPVATPPSNVTYPRSVTTPPANTGSGMPIVRPGVVPSTAPGGVSQGGSAPGGMAPGFPPAAPAAPGVLPTAPAIR